MEIVKGTYCLKIYCGKNIKASIGKLGRTEFKKGWYLYTGSAAGGIESRVLRHLGKRKKLFWHIDYLLSRKDIDVEIIYYLPGRQKLECKISRDFSSILKPVRGFGSSDCRCIGHLYLLQEDLFGQLEELMVRGHGFRSLPRKDFIKRYSIKKGM